MGEASKFEGGEPDTPRVGEQALVFSELRVLCRNFRDFCKAILDVPLVGRWDNPCPQGSPAGTWYLGWVKILSRAESQVCLVLPNLVWAYLHLPVSINVGVS